MKNKLLLLLSFISIITFAQESQKMANKKIKVLNIGMFHMGETSDANKTEYNEASKKAKKEIDYVVKSIANFKPTIILVEQEPKYQIKLEEAYKKYKADTGADIGYYGKSEIGLIAFAIGKKTNVKNIYGVDHKMEYNYDLEDIAKKNKSTKYFELLDILNNELKGLIGNVNQIGLKNTLLLLNTDKSYDFLLNYNADMLSYVSSENGFEGADEAAKFYQRNLRMFSNINKVPMSKEDRVLIISGATHAAFFNMFMKRSPIYELQSINMYLE